MLCANRVEVKLCEPGQSSAPLKCHAERGDNFVIGRFLPGIREWNALEHGENVNGTRDRSRVLELCIRGRFMFEAHVAGGFLPVAKNTRSVGVSLVPQRFSSRLAIRSCSLILGKCSTSSQMAYGVGTDRLRAARSI